jgi:hypothetical protein
VTSTPRVASAHLAPSGPLFCTPMSRMAVSSSVPWTRSSCWARIRKLNTWRRSAIGTANS